MEILIGILILTIISLVTISVISFKRFISPIILNYWAIGGVISVCIVLIGIILLI